MHFSLSSKTAMQEMLALTALRHRAEGLNKPSPALTPDFAAGMRFCLRDAFACVVMHLADIVTAVDMDQLDTDPADPYSLDCVNMHLDIDLPSDFPDGKATALRRRLESAVAKEALALTEPEPFSANYARMAAETFDGIRAMVMSARPSPLRISPSF